MAVPGELHALIERFERDLPSYRSAGFNEAQARIDFINPLFALLGWDIENQRGLPEAYREVVYEDRVKVGGGTKAPDYGFYAGGQRRFFLEAKKPSVDIAGDVAPAVQLRRYAWSARLPLSVLTDFEEFAVYDCRFEPQKEDGPATARTELFTYDRYAEEEVWARISSLFSREAVLSGSLEKYAEENRRRRGTETVDSAFLREIEGWRDALARDLAARNGLNQRQLNYAVQMTIDRIIFLRMAEDRGIEEYGRLLALVNGNDVYGRLCEIFREADDRYNSGLFHFRDEKDREEKPDTLTPSLEVGDRLLRRIIRGLYYPESPYEFSVLPVDVLGQVYEQFLGKVIRLTRSGHRAKVEEKPEVRKAGGVYYTPTYIVDYIVKNTVGKLLEGKRPGTRGGASRLRIVDPACGSGSFLIGAYQYLLDWHRDRYVEDGPEKHPKQLYQGHGGQWHLTIDEKKRILLNNIHGVDIDPQAVEVTKLSLLLKVLEGESEASLATQLRMFQERALPDLDDNIKCGNSLIGPDFYDNKQMMLLDEEEHYRINVFDWKKSFPQVFSGEDPGFDAVIGNPPYVNAWEFYANSPRVREFINKSTTFTTADRHWDLYVLFLERAFQVARTGGRISFIIPFAYAIQKYAMRSRQMLLENFTIESIADIRRVRVFGAVPVITMIPVVIKTLPSSQHAIRIEQPREDSTKAAVSRFVFSHEVPQAALLDQHEQMLRLDLSQEALDLVRKIERKSAKLGSICYVNYGAQMSSKIKGAFGKNHVIRTSPENGDHRKMIGGRELYRYEIRWQGRYVDWSFASQMYGPRWPEFFESPKLMIRDITGTHRIEATLDKNGYYCDHTVLCALRKCEVQKWRDFPTSDIALSSHYDDRYLCGLVASKLVSAYYYLVLTGEGVRIGGGFHTYPHTIRNLPIYRLDLGNQNDVAWHDRMVGLVERMLELHERLAEARIERERAVIGAQISATDRQIDHLVYELYGLTDDEIRIVEEATAR